MTFDRAVLAAAIVATVWVGACRAVVWAIDRHENLIDQQAGDTTW